MKILTTASNKYALKILIAAEYVGVKIDVPPFEMGKDNKTTEFLQMNPFGKIPVLVTDQGAIFESNAIARYVARLKDVGLLGSSLEEQAAVDQWIDVASLQIDPPLMSWVHPLFSTSIPYDKKKEKAAIETVENLLKTLDAYLADRTFLVKDSVTLADIIMCCNLLSGFRHVFDDAFLAPLGNLKRYFFTVINQKEFKNVIGDFQLCKKAAKYTPPKKESHPKAEAKKEAPPAAEASEEPKKVEKGKTWVDLLPPTPMPLDSFKRLYSNCPSSTFRQTFLPLLWNGGEIPKSPNNEVFPGMDTNGYSFWFANYKYDEENTVNFMVSNKVGGFLQRMDFARKFAFGVLLILKDEAKGIFPIRGVWIFRGSDIPEVVLKESDDMELYTLTKVDLSNPEQKKRMEDIMCEDGEVDGMEIVDSKVFK